MDSTGKTQPLLTTPAPAVTPRLSPDGKRLAFSNSGDVSDDRIMVAGYTAKGDSFAPDKPRQWSPTPILTTGNLQSFNLAPDGKRFVVFPVRAETSGDDKASVHVTVLLNFFDELRRRLPPGK